MHACSIGNRHTHTHSLHISSAPEISRVHTFMLFYFLACHYLLSIISSIHVVRPPNYAVYYMTGGCFLSSITFTGKLIKAGAFNPLVRKLALHLQGKQAKQVRIAFGLGS